MTTIIAPCIECDKPTVFAGELRGNDIVPASAPVCEACRTKISQTAYDHKSLADRLERLLDTAAVSLRNQDLYASLLALQEALKAAHKLEKGK